MWEEIRTTHKTTFRVPDGSRPHGHDRRVTLRILEFDFVSRLVLGFCTSTVMCWYEARDRDVHIERSQSTIFPSDLYSISPNLSNQREGFMHED